MSPLLPPASSSISLASEVLLTARILTSASLTSSALLSPRRLRLLFLPPDQVFLSYSGLHEVDKAAPDLKLFKVSPSNCWLWLTSAPGSGIPRDFPQRGPQTRIIDPPDVSRWMWASLNCWFSVKQNIKLVVGMSMCANDSWSMQIRVCIKWKGHTCWNRTGWWGSNSVFVRLEKIRVMFTVVFRELTAGPSRAVGHDNLATIYITLGLTFGAENHIWKTFFYKIWTGSKMQKWSLSPEWVHLWQLLWCTLSWDDPRIQ